MKFKEVIKYIRHHYTAGSTKKKLKVLAAAVYSAVSLLFGYLSELQAQSHNLQPAPLRCICGSTTCRCRHLVRQSFSPCHGYEHQMMLNVYHRAIERRLAFEARTEAPVLLESDASSARLDWPVGAARFVVVCNSQDT